MEFSLQLYGAALLIAQGKRSCEAYLELQPKDAAEVRKQQAVIIAAFALFRPEYQMKALQDALEMPVLIGHGKPELIIRATSTAVAVIEAFGVYEIPTTQGAQS